MGKEFQRLDASSPSSRLGERQFDFLPGPSGRSIRIIFRGFWDLESNRRYRHALHQRAIQSGGVSPVRRVLIDLMDCSVQSNDVIEGQAEILAAYASQIDEYAMLFPPSSLLKVQMKRLMQSTNVVYFDTERDALIWLEQGAGQ